jgi:type II restriction enzyme
MAYQVISDQAIQRRLYWVEEIKKLSGNFSDDYLRLERELREEIRLNGLNVLIEHLRLCGNIPESYRHDSSEEKLYSKYTDYLVSLAYENIGMRSIVLTERADSADVEAFSSNYNFVADAKVFRLSRTAKNQKDFKVDAMHNWKRDKDYAMIVCPIYQLPNSSSQIYWSATSKSVCILTYSHLALLVQYAHADSQVNCQELIFRIFNAVSAMNPSKTAMEYWFNLNKTMIDYSDIISSLWQSEKVASSESLVIAKEQDLNYLSAQRTAIMSMSHQEALSELIRINKIDSKIKTISNVRDSGIFTLND